MKHTAIAVTTGFFLVHTLTSHLSARQVEFWPYERLRDAADLIVVAEPVESKDTGEIVHGSLWQVDFVGVNTTLKVTGILKGRYLANEMVLYHLRLPEGLQLANGPFQAKLRTQPAVKRTAGGSNKTVAPEYLLFLSKRKDGRFEPVSGPMESGYAVRELQLPSNDK